MKSTRRSLYKGEYFIVFYDENDEELLYMFDNVRDILHFQRKKITRTNVNLINVELYRALKTDNHFIRFLNGERMRVYIIKLEDEKE